MSKLDLSFCIVFFTVFILAISSVAVVASPIDKDEYLEITISEGDTLWEISREYNDLHNMESIKFIEWVSKVNEIEKSYIIPGQKILIPVKLEKVKMQGV